MSEWTEEDILERLKDNAEDEHRNYIYPDMALAILNLIKDRDAKIANLTVLFNDADDLLNRLASAALPINQTEEE